MVAGAESGGIQINCMGVRGNILEGREGEKTRKRRRHDNSSYNLRQEFLAEEKINLSVLQKENIGSFGSYRKTDSVFVVSS